MSKYKVWVWDTEKREKHNLDEGLSREDACEEACYYRSDGVTAFVEAMRDGTIQYGKLSCS